MNFSLRSAFLLTLVLCVAVNAQDAAPKADAPKAPKGGDKKSDPEKTAKAQKALTGVSEGLKAGGLTMPAGIVSSVGTGLGGGGAGGGGAGKRMKRNAIVL